MVSSKMALIYVALFLRGIVYATAEYVCLCNFHSSTVQVGYCGFDCYIIRHIKLLNTINEPRYDIVSTHGLLSLVFYCL